jgi:putative FmdB family regulatory protein
MHYDYECSACNTKFEDFKPVADRHFSTCPNCGAAAKLLFSPTVSKTKIFQPYWDPNISDKPVYIESSDHKKALLREKGLEERVEYRPGDKYLTRWV